MLARTYVKRRSPSYDMAEPEPTSRDRSNIHLRNHGEDELSNHLHDLTEHVLQESADHDMHVHTADRILAAVAGGTVTAGTTFRVARAHPGIITKYGNFMTCGLSHK